MAELPSCGRSPTTASSAGPEATAREIAPPPKPSGPALPLDRIAIVGASISAGFGGTPFGDAFTAAAPRSQVTSAADTMLFRDPIGNTKKQLALARDTKATTIVAIDLLFWDVYGSSDRTWHDAALASALAELEAARAAGAWIILGDVPLITTASELLLPKSAIPSAELLGAANNEIRAFAAKDRVLLVPLGEWTAPLRQADGEVALSTGEKVPARSLLGFDGLHANELGVWFLLDRLDRYIEEKLPGTPSEALVFRRPPAQ